MQFIIKGQNIDVTEAIKRHAQDKLKKIINHSDQVIKIEVEFKVEKNPSVHDCQAVEVIIFTKGPMIRASVATNDMYVSIDHVVEKLEKQIEKYKGKLYRSNVRHQGVSAAPKAEVGPETFESQDEEPPSIVKVKQIPMKPMSAEEAAMQLDLIGHEFFVFTNSENEETNVIYRRRDGNYGLIEPSLSDLD
ncbi:MAG: ribosome-associated translation inhibitor RaiA [Actinomycetota bacterium]|nr:ribosome-associated translation inhibitor RaiA [Actinomycetota bacterium]